MTERAKHRTDNIIKEIMQNPYYKNLCKVIARSDLADDLYQEFLLALLTHPNLIPAYRAEWFHHFCVKIIKNLYESTTSTFSTKYRHFDRVITYTPNVCDIELPYEP